ncbi:hypothetical protein BT63DRAFT_378924 [Microthyrium microscopicum]|uniref:Calponin-homology (CH) domain-containing protein n=1 Tax=Microthyrium microscopicum TaxID=703497 RepID=A0A6A6U111_9PEZI|nr:hypothetical protein BT63DRAFT_378924 [Microthyrium microscopicum]
MSTSHSSSTDTLIPRSVPQDHTILKSNTEPLHDAAAKYLESQPSTESPGRTPSPPAALSPPSFSSDGCPQLDLSTSTEASSASSARSTSSRLSDSGLSVKKRGYRRPQATTFAPSAKSRESVMSLGSIAHLQYYFARTGLLDGKGGQLARKNPNLHRTQTEGSRSASLNLPGTHDDLSLSPTASNYALSESGMMSESPIDQTDDPEWDRELALLPPTVSTYNHRPAYVEPPPNVTMLRRELTESLEDALKVLKESDKAAKADETQGFYEIQGLHLLDITTLAIRAAKNYYTAHSQYQRLHAIKSEREIRQELYHVLEILKRMASRNFAGGMKQAEKVGILTWIVGISELIQTEIDAEKQDTEEREKWSWRSGDWTGRERERELAFIRCFISDPSSLPDWPDPTNLTEPSAFLSHFQDGLALVHLHNSCVQKSKRHFEEIKVFHTDTAKPYRCADNLRYWVKAAELRWDIRLKLDVMGVAQNSTDMGAWLQLDAALLQWCRGVREELTAELVGGKDGKRTPPRLKVESDTSIVETPVEVGAEVPADENAVPTEGGVMSMAVEASVTSVAGAV